MGTQRCIRDGARSSQASVLSYKGSIGSKTAAIAMMLVCKALAIMCRASSGCMQTRSESSRRRLATAPRSSERKRGPAPRNPAFDYFLISPSTAHRDRHLRPAGCAHRLHVTVQIPMRPLPSTSKRRAPTLSLLLELLPLPLPLPPPPTLLRPPAVSRRCITGHIRSA